MSSPGRVLRWGVEGSGEKEEKWEGDELESVLAVL